MGSIHFGIIAVIFISLLIVGILRWGYQIMMFKQWLRRKLTP